MVTTMDIGSKWTWQGGQGPTCHADWPHMGATLAPAMSSIRGSCSRSILKRPFNVNLGSLSYRWSLQPTYKLTSCPNFGMCYLSNHHWGASKVLRSRDNDPRANQHLSTTAYCPRCSTDLLVSYKYPLTLHYKYGVWSSVEKCPIHFPSSPSFSKLSSLA
jgi:hypothetical protein